VLGCELDLSGSV